MVNFVDVIGKGFERLLRWLYPGALFLVLLYLSGTYTEVNKYIDINLNAHPINIWGIALVIVVAGMVIYLAHVYIFNQLISVFFDWIGMLDKEVSRSWRWVKFLATHAEKWGELSARKWGISGSRSDGRTSGWFDYSWSTYHAGVITVWLTLLFYCFASTESNMLRGIPVWVLVLVLFISFVSLLWQYVILTRLNFRIPN